MNDPQVASPGPTDFTAWADLLTRGATELGVTVGHDALRRLWEYAGVLQEWSRRMNLVGSSAPGLTARVHILDSMAVLRFLPASTRLCADVGTGAGLPGMVAALVAPGTHWALIDASHKRCSFLSHVQSALQVANVTVHCARAEEIGRDPAMREAHDVAVSRAVGPLEVVAEYCLPLVRVGGQCLALKGPAVEKEVGAASAAIQRLGGRMREVVQYRLPLGDEERRAVVIDKIGRTPDKFPRRAGVAAKRAREVDRRRRGV